MVNFFSKFEVTLYKAEKIQTHGGSIRIYIKKGKNHKTEQSFKNILKEEDKFGIKRFKTYEKFGREIYKIRENVRKNIKKIKDNGNNVFGYGAPAKASTALNFFGISKEFDFIVEDNKLKHNRFIPGVKIPIKSKKFVSSKNNVMIVLAWNFFEDIKKNNSQLSSKIINIKSLEKN